LRKKLARKKLAVFVGNIDFSEQRARDHFAALEGPATLDDDAKRDDGCED
jgi:hypothetical protein